MNEYIVLSKSQREWMCKVIKNMVELTAYYSFATQPLKEADYENIAGAFSNYTKKSKNNAMIIKSAVALSTYLDGVAKQGKRLDKEQMRMIEEEVEKLFDVADQYQKHIGDEDQKKAALVRLDMCGQNLNEHPLFKELKGIFKEYLLFCKEEMKEHVLLEPEVQRNEAPVRTSFTRNR